MGQNLRILCCAVFLASSVFAAPAFSDPCDGDNCKLTSDGQWKSFNFMQYSWASCLDQSTGADITQCPAYVLGLTSPCYQIKVGNSGGTAPPPMFIPMGSAAEFNSFMHSSLASDPNYQLSFQACPNTGACGTANGQQFADLASLTAAQTCTTSAVAAPSGSGPWNWTCRSTVQGYPAVACSAAAPGLPAPVNGTCGTASGIAASTAPTANLCTTGTASIVAGSGPWTWSCNGSNGGSNDTSCQAAMTVTGLVKGSCGSASGSTVSSAPTSNLCNIGTASSVTGIGPWNWSCRGTGGTIANGGDTSTCSASPTQTPIFDANYCKQYGTDILQYQSHSLSIHIADASGNIIEEATGAIVPHDQGSQYVDGNWSSTNSSWCDRYTYEAGYTLTGDWWTDMTHSTGCASYIPILNCSVVRSNVGWPVEGSAPPPPSSNPYNVAPRTTDTCTFSIDTTTGAISWIGGTSSGGPICGAQTSYGGGGALFIGNGIGH